MSHYGSDSDTADNPAYELDRPEWSPQGENRDSPIDEPHPELQIDREFIHFPLSTEIKIRIYAGTMELAESFISGPQGYGAQTMGRTPTRHSGSEGSPRNGGSPGGPEYLQGRPFGEDDHHDYLTRVKVEKRSRKGSRQIPTTF